MTTEKKTYSVDNAIIMAAGLSSRFAPLSYEYPKALVEVKGEVLIERQIRQLQEVGITDITVVVGYKRELFDYLVTKHGVKIVENPEYMERNNHSTLYYVKDRLANTYICSADNYFTENVFEAQVEQPYYAAVFEEGITDEWVFQTNEEGLITDIKVGGADSWIMLGHVFFSKEFSQRFVEILENIYHLPETAPLFWENIYLNHIDELPLYIRKYPDDVIFEFDSLDELRTFDSSYWTDTRSTILKEITRQLEVEESKVCEIEPRKKNGATIGFDFTIHNQSYVYFYNEEKLIKK